MKTLNDGCISDEELAAWANGAVSNERTAAIQEHIASCTTCRTVAAEVARTSGERPVPKMLGRYRLQEAIGRGGMGTVYAAWDPTLERQVAVKVLHETHRTERFLLERQVLASLEHPNIARLLDAGETEEGRPWFAMDFVDGKPLDLACDEKKLTSRARLELMLPVFRAVAFAHQHLVVHRDLKPSNILVDASGQPRLVDFGIARLLENSSGLTQTGTTPMTPAYASPEQVRREPAAVTSDVYSLGVVLYELLTGVSPYATKPGDVEALLVAVASAEPKPPSEVNGALNGDIDAIVLMALRKEPGDRYQSVQALADDVTAALDGLPTLARRGNTAYRAARFVRRRKALVAGVVTAFIALSVGLVATLWQAKRAEAERDLAQSRFNQVRSLAKAVLFDYHDGIADLPGSTALRERLVKDAQGYLETLAAQADDAALKQELATSYLKLGDVQGDPYAASLGDTAAAKRSYESGRALAEAVLKERPHDRAARRTIASSIEKLGAIEEVTGTLEGALAMYLQAVELAGTLVTEQPDDLEQRVLLGRYETATGQTLLQLARLDEAAKHLETALEIKEALATVRPDLNNRRALGGVLISLAQLHGEQMQSDKGIKLAKRAADLFTKLSLDFPDSVEARRGKRMTLSTLEQLYRVTGNQESALAYAREAVQDARTAAARDPEDSVAQRDLVVALAGLCTSLGASELHKEAIPLEKEALAVQHALHTADPDNVQVMRDLTSMLESFCFASAVRDEFDIAESRCAEASKLAASLRAQDSDNLSVREDAAMIHDSMVLVRIKQARFEEAKVENQRLIDMLTLVLKEDPSLKRVENRITLAEASRAELFVRIAEKQGDKAAWQVASAQLEKAMKLRDELIARDVATDALLAANTDLADLRRRCEAALAGKPLPPLPK